MSQRSYSSTRRSEDDPRTVLRVQVHLETGVGHPGLHAAVATLVWADWAGSQVSIGDYRPSRSSASHLAAKVLAT